MLREQFALTLSLSQRNGSEVAVLYVDLDRFKAVNDEMGHAAGDVLLQKVVDRLRQTTRASDIVARVGGDEFVILQTQVRQPDAADVLAARIVEALSVPFDLNGTRAHVGASIGTALYPEDGTDADALVRQADAALYAAKAAGRNRYCFPAERCAP